MCIIFIHFFQAEDDQEQPGDIFSVAQAQQGQPGDTYPFQYVTSTALTDHLEHGRSCIFRCVWIRAVMAYLPTTAHCS